MPACSPPSPPSDPTAFRRRLDAEAYSLGFDLVGVAHAGEAESWPAFDAWLAAGHAGDMHYLARGSDKRRDTRLPYEGARSAIVVGMDYGGKEPHSPVARYARGADYHDVMVDRLRQLHAWLNGALGAEVAGKAYVDTGPILERDLARRAGLGWFGKNTNLINPTRGSFFFLGALLVAADLEPDAPFEEDRCGRCTRCLDACPTQAFTGPRSLDATRCISYLTIELRTAIPGELRTMVGEWIYGCDVCQEVCPWNVKFSRELPDASPYAAREALGGNETRTLARELLDMTQEDFSRAFKGSPMKRAKLRGLQRNAAVVLGNVGSAEDIDVLTRARENPEPLVREHAEWALRRIADR